MSGSDARNRASRAPGAHPGSPVPDAERSAGRVEAEEAVIADLEAWRASVVPDRSATFDADTLAHLVRTCYTALGIDPEVGAGFSVNTVHYYRRKDVLDEPGGRTSAARYDVRHLWQAVGARLAGHLGLVTLAEARHAIRGGDEETLLAFVAARVVDARLRRRMRRTTATAFAAVPPTQGVRAHGAVPAPVRARPLPGALAAAAGESRAEGHASSVVIPLPGDAWCIVPASHPAHHSPSAAQDVVAALAAALRVTER